MNKTVYYSAKRRYLLLLLISLIFAAGGLFMIFDSTNPKSIPVGWLLLILFGGIALVFIWEVIDTRPRIIIDENGLYDRTLKIGTIPWSDIKGAYIASMSGHLFICLQLEDDSKYISKLNPVLRTLVSGNVALGYTPFSLNLNGISADPKQICDLILERSANAQSR